MYWKCSCVELKISSLGIDNAVLLPPPKVTALCVFIHLGKGIHSHNTCIGG